MTEGRRWPKLLLGWLAGIAAAAAAYYFFTAAAVSGESGTVTLTFLLLVPAVACAIAAFLSDSGEASLAHYLLTPFAMLAVIIVSSAILLGEGIICILMLAPLWIVGGVAGSLLAYAMKKRLRPARQALRQQRFARPAPRSAGRSVATGPGALGDGEPGGADRRAAGGGLAAAGLDP